jgi:Protein of unknown function (DUF664)
VLRTSPSTLPASERESLEEWLDFHRDTLLLKCDGLSAKQLAIASCPPSELTLLGLVRHLIGVEDWFHSFDDEPAMDPFPDEDYFTPYPEHADRDLASYRAAVERSRRAVAGRALDEVIDLDHWVADGQLKEIRPTSLRWVYQHMIEEYARHNGHADFIRERIDGSVGD